MTNVDHLPAFARDAHDKMLTAWDLLAQGILRREGPAMEAELIRQGKTTTEAAQGAETHVARIRAAMQIERARLEAEAVQRWQ
tara:strand:- start:69 stop:317 length:249 start_codon:yes stop_codon:yes gene_type:complete